MIDLDALERLATEASRTPWVTIEASVSGPDGTAAVLYRDVRAASAQIRLHTACDPVTVAALVRAVKAAQIVAELNQRETFGDETLTGFEWGAATRTLAAALAPFAPDPGEETGE